jgi:predicted dehydrogenase
MVTELIKSRKLKWGVVGLGRFSEEAFLPAIQHLRKSKVVSVFSYSFNRAKIVATKFGIPNYFDDYNEFLKSDIDVVYIASSNDKHYEQAIEAANSGKHIFCEKPLALNSTQAEEMVNVANQRKVLFAVNFIHNFHPLTIKAKELINTLNLGKIVSVQANFNIDFPPNENYRFNRAKSGGGALRDLGSHMLNLLRYFGGEISEIDGYLDNIVYQSEVEDFASAIVKFKNSGYGYFNVSYNSKRAFNRLEIICHRGSIEIDNLMGRKIIGTKLSIVVDGEAKKSFRKGGNKMLYALKSVQDSFLKNEIPLVTGYDGLVNMKLMEELERKCQSKMK